MSDSPKGKRLWHQSPWKWFFSLRIGVVLLLIIAVASIAGTLIPKTDEMSALQRSYLYVYHTPWFLALLLLLAANITLVTVRSVVEKIIPFQGVHFRRSANFFKLREPSLALRFEGDAQRVASELQEQGFKTALDGEGFGYAWKGKIGRWGAPIAHLGVVLMLLSGFSASMDWVAGEGAVTIMEGGSATILNGKRLDPKITRDPKRTPEPGEFTIICDDFEEGLYARSAMSATFISTVSIPDADPPILAETVEVNKSLFVNGWYIHQSGFNALPSMPRFLTEISRSDQKEPLAMEISPGQKRFVPGLGETAMALGRDYPYPWTITSPEGEVYEGLLFEKVNGQGVHLRIDRFEPDFIMVGGDFKSRSQELNNPALQVSLLDARGVIAQQWLFGRADMKEMMKSMSRKQDLYDLELKKVTGNTPDYHFEISATRLKDQKHVGDFDAVLLSTVALEEPAEAVAAAPVEAKNGPWEVKLIKSVPAQVTTLSLTRNIAIPVIYFSCCLMVFGMIVAFGTNRKEVWFSVDPSRKLPLRLAGVYRYPRESFDPKTLRALKTLCPGQKIENDA